MTPVHVLAASGETLHERLFVALAVVVVSARLFGGLPKRIGQPSVVGEIAAGIVLGPSCLAAVAAGPHEFLFPPEVMPRLGAIADVGLVLFMFLVGRDVDVASIRRLAPKALVISPVSIAVPMALGWLLAGWMYPRYGEGVDRTAFCLFVGTCMAITAFPCWPGSCRRRACRARPWGSWPSPVPRSTTSSPGACSSWSRRWSTPRGRRRWRRRPNALDIAVRDKAMELGLEYPWFGRASSPDRHSVPAVNPVPASLPRRRQQPNVAAASSPGHHNGHPGQT
jgi:hypothetical protein